MAAIATQPVSIPQAGLPNPDSISFCQASLDEKLKNICDDFLTSQDPKLFNARIDNELNTTKAATALSQPDKAALKAAAQQLVDEILTFGETSYNDILGVKNDSSPEEVLRSWRLRGCTIRPYLSHGEAPLQQSARKAFIALMRAAREKSISQRDILEVVEWEGLVDLNALPDDDGTLPTEAPVNEPPQEIANIYEEVTEDMVALKLDPHNKENKKMGKLRSDLYQWIIPLEFFSPQYTEAAQRYKSLDDKPADKVAADGIDKLKQVVDMKITRHHFKQGWSIPSASAYVNSSKEIKRIMSCTTTHERLNISTGAGVAAITTVFQDIISTMHPVFAFRRDASEALNVLCAAATEVGIGEEDVSAGREWDGGSWTDPGLEEGAVPGPPSAIKELYLKAYECMVKLSHDLEDGAALSVVEDINNEIEKLELGNDASESSPVWTINLEWWCQTFRDIAKQTAILKNDTEDQGARENVEGLIENINTYLKRSHLLSDWLYGSAEKYF
ncbi:chaperone [Fusarium coicis]|nr:chaperone [Fusarium coicis]